MHCYKTYKLQHFIRWAVRSQRALNQHVWCLTAWDTKVTRSATSTKYGDSALTFVATAPIAAWIAKADSEAAVTPGTSAVANAIAVSSEKAFFATCNRSTTDIATGGKKRLQNTALMVHSYRPSIEFCRFTLVWLKNKNLCECLGSIFTAS